MYVPFAMFVCVFDMDFACSAVVPLPIPPSDNSTRIAALELVGQLIGLSIRTGTVMRLDLPPIIWKALVGEEVNDDDVRSIDSFSFRIIDQIQSLLSRKELPRELFDSMLSDRTFSVIGGDGVTYPIVPNGTATSVTVENARQFCTALARYKRNEFKVQCDALFRGIASVVPIQMLPLLTWSELDTLVTGGSGTSADIDMLERTAVYRSGYTATHSTIKMFWVMLRSAFNDSDRTNFLSYVWGRSRVPKTVEGFAGQFFTISKASFPKRIDVNRAFPISRTSVLRVRLFCYIAEVVVCRSFSMVQIRFHS